MILLSMILPLSFQAQSVEKAKRALRHFEWIEIGRNYFLTGSQDVQDLNPVNHISIKRL